jgi:hypothetical protein
MKRSAAIEAILEKTFEARGKSKAATLRNW